MACYTYCKFRMNLILPMQSRNRREIYTRALHLAGMRLTPQRQAICVYLASTDRHPTPYEVYADIASLHPEISRATVYNTLNTLQQLGAIVELSFCWLYPLRHQPRTPHQSDLSALPQNYRL